MDTYKKFNEILVKIQAHKPLDNADFVFINELPKENIIEIVSIFNSQRTGLLRNK
jgi:hypothetical protein